MGSSNMNKLSASVWVVIMLAGCAPSRQELALTASQQCNNPGINVMSPNFQASASPAAIEAFYSCMIEKTQPSDRVLIGAPGSPVRNMFNGEDEGKTALQQPLAYQRTLWRQIASGERTRNSAQEAWILWSSQTAQKEEAIQALNAQAAAVNQLQEIRSSPTHCTGMNMGGGMASINCE